MPEMDGLTLAKEIRQRMPALHEPHVLMLSSQEKNMCQDEADKTGIYKMLTKPVKMYELYALLCSMFVNAMQEEREIAPIPTIKKIVDAGCIMVVEDDPINMMLISEVLRKMGFEVVKAENGKRAIELLPTCDPLLIFMDVNMPQMDGYATTRLIRKLPEPYCSLTIIALTADAMQGDKERCIEAGMNDYISKPFRVEEIEAVLKRRTQLVQ